MLWKKHLVMTAVAVLLLAPVAVAGDRYDDFEDTHPLRIVSYPVHAGGVFFLWVGGAGGAGAWRGAVLAWLVARPLHALVSKPKLEPIFGHDKHPFDFDEQIREAPAPTEYNPG